MFRRTAIATKPHSSALGIGGGEDNVVGIEKQLRKARDITLCSIRYFRPKKYYISRGERGRGMNFDKSKVP